MTVALIIAWAFGLAAVGLTYRYVVSLGEDIDHPDDFAQCRARCDEVAALTARVKRLEAELAAVESNP